MPQMLTCDRQLIVIFVGKKDRPVSFIWVFDFGKGGWGDAEGRSGSGWEVWEEKRVSELRWGYVE